MAAIRRCCDQVRASRGLKQNTTDKRVPKVKKKVVNCAAISELGDRAANDWEKVV